MPSRSSPAPSADALARYRESSDSVELLLRRPTTRYLDQFLALRSAPDLIAAEIYPNAKEITESMAAVRALLRNGGLDPHDPRVAAICVGDGTTPRTAALLAYRTRWTCWSVDPTTRGEYSVRRLTAVRMPVEDFSIDWVGPVAITAVHAHVELSVAVDRLAELGLDVCAAVAIPCCGFVHQTTRIPLRWQGVDWGIWSPDRTVRAWGR